MLKKIISIAFLAIVIQTFVFGMQPIKTKAADSASSFTLSNIKGSRTSLSDFTGKSVILFFWTTWCPYCRKELKTLDQMRESLSRDGVEVLAINVGETSNKVDNFAQSNQVTFTVLLDKETSVAESYGVMGVPTFILIDKKGQIVFNGHRFPQEYKSLL